MKSSFSYPSFVATACFIALLIFSTSCANSSKQEVEITSQPEVSTIKDDLPEVETTEPIEDVSFEQSTPSTPTRTLALNYEEVFQERIPKAEPKSYTITGSIGGDITLPSGIKMHIPRYTFVDEDGHLISGEVELKVTDMGDIGSILKSGYPMHALDENGKPANFQSSGMFEIRGPDGVQFGEGKSIDVMLPSEQTETDYHLWQINEETGNWERLESNLPVTGGQSSAITPVPSFVSSQIRTSFIPPIDGFGGAEFKPSKPTSYSPGNSETWREPININPYTVPCLTNFSQLYFKPTEGNKFPHVEDSGYRNIVLRQVGNSGLTIEFINLYPYKDSVNPIIPVEPVFTDNQMAQAEAYYTRAITTWEVDSMVNSLYEFVQDSVEINGYVRKVFDRTFVIRRASVSLDRYAVSKVNAWCSQLTNDARKLAEETELQRLGVTAEDLKEIQEVTRNINISGFGVYNCDRFFDMPTFPLACTFTNSHQKQLNLLYCKLVDLDRNVLLPIGSQTHSTNSIDVCANVKYAIVGVDVKGEIYHGTLNTRGKNDQDKYTISFENHGSELNFETAFAGL